MALHDHTGDGDYIGFGAALEIDFLDILIDERDAMRLGRQCSNERQGRHRHVGALAEQWQRVLKPPEGDLEFRIDEDDVGHVLSPRASREDCIELWVT